MRDQTPTPLLNPPQSSVLNPVVAALDHRTRNRNLTSVQVAAGIGVSGQTVSRWRSGDKVPMLTHAVAWAEFVELRLAVVDGHHVLATGQAIAGHLRQLRERQAITQAGLGRRRNIAASMISALERTSAGDGRVLLTTLSAHLHALNVRLTLLAPVKAITIRQPWAHLIATGHKDVENRSRPTTHRGTIAIHTSLTVDWDAEFATADGRNGTASADRAHGVDDIADRVDAWLGHRWWQPREQAQPGPATAALGAVIAVADVVACCPGDCTDSAVGGCSRWAIPGKSHWQLAGVRPLTTPVPARGQLGLWTLPDEIADAVRNQLPATAHRGDTGGRA